MTWFLDFILARRGRCRGKRVRVGTSCLSACLICSPPTLFVRDKPDPPHSSNRFSSPHPPASSTSSSPAMASVLLRRQLAHTQSRTFANASKSCRSGIVERGLRTSAVVRQAEPVHASASAERRGTAPTEAGRPKNLTDVHTVEDLQGMTALDLLTETGNTRKDAQMRHFTGKSTRLC